MHRFKKIFVLLTVLLTSALALVGCAGVPSSGSVQTGLSNLKQTDEQVVFDPSGPLPGATQEEVLRGFLVAASSANHDYAVAREYLTPAFADVWEPRAIALIDEGTRPFQQISETSASVSISTIAQVDRNGILTVNPTQSQTSELNFEFERVGNEWRISRAPVGIVLDRSMFTTVWMQISLYYPDSTGTLFADQRWFVNDTLLMQRVLEQLLAGPSAMHQLAYSPAIPNSVALQSPPLIDDGRINVELSSAFAELSDTAIDTFAAQLNATLAPLGVLDHYTISTASNRSVREGWVATKQEEELSKFPYALRNNSFGELRGSLIEGQTALAEPLQKLKPLDAMVNIAGDRAAVLTTKGVHLVQGDSETLVDARKDLLNPSLDPWGYVWTAAPGSSSQIFVQNGEGAPTEFQVPAVELDGLQQIRVSADGNLLAMLVTRNSQTSVLVSGISRDAHGAPNGLDPAAHLVLTQTGNAVDIDWIDGSRFVVLSRVSEAAKVTVGGVGLLPTDRGVVPNGISVAAADSSRGLRVLDTDGTVLRPQGANGWTQAASEIALLAKRI